jgi:hypothetical protein
MNLVAYQTLGISQELERKIQGKKKEEQGDKEEPTSLTTVLWSLRSGLGVKFLEFGGGLGERRGGFSVK